MNSNIWYMQFPAWYMQVVNIHLKGELVGGIIKKSIKGIFLTFLNIVLVGGWVLKKIITCWRNIRTAPDCLQSLVVKYFYIRSMSYRHNVAGIMHVMSTCIRRKSTFKGEVGFCWKRIKLFLPEMINIYEALNFRICVFLIMKRENLHLEYLRHL